MTTTRPQLAATDRQILGKHVAQLRRAGSLPAVIYGHGVASQAVTIDAHDFEMLHRRTGPNALVDVSVDGHKAAPVLIHSIQRDPVHQRVLHVDLLAVRMTEELTVEVPIVFTGVAPAVDLSGGTLLHMIEAVRVRALPDHLPQSLPLAIDSLVDYEVTLHVRDLLIPSDVTLLTDLDEAVVRVQAPRQEEVAPVVAEAEGEPAAEDAEAAEPGESTES
ncbi:MAG: 50S ribosomal protein L25 [Candidatus Limnocylindrales bacterium]